MYSKLYKTIFDGSLYGQFEALTVFMAMLALADRHGEVDAAPAKIAGCLGCGTDFVHDGITALGAPDPYSRTPTEEGRRIIPLVDDEGNDRIFGWKIVNYEKYRSIRNEEERRAYKRDWDRTHRGKSEPTKSDRARPKPTYTDTDTDTEALKPMWLDQKAWGEFVQHRKDIKKPLSKLAAKKNLKILETHQDQQQDIVDKTIANRWTGLFSPKGANNEQISNQNHQASRKNDAPSKVQAAIEKRDRINPPPLTGEFERH